MQPAINGQFIRSLEQDPGFFCKKEENVKKVAKKVEDVSNKKGEKKFLKQHKIEKQNKHRKNSLF